MAFELKNTVPWGRTLNEYQKMFCLSPDDFCKSIISFGDGPASFNYEMMLLKKSVTSIDPIYAYSKQELLGQIELSKGKIMHQIRANSNNYIWNEIRNPDHLEQIRMKAMNVFLEDYDCGKLEGRYINHQLPKRTHFEDKSFDLGVSSHFLLLYDQLGVDFHIESISEMLRICKEIRIFPIVNLNGDDSLVVNQIIDVFSKDFKIDIIKSTYEFQQGGSEYLKIYS